MKLLVSGCSMTHGAELYNGFMHPENIKLSYSQHIADKLKINLLNVALSAGSNEYIFHSLIEEICKNDDIHSVIVMWTTTGRLCWKSNNRYYFFLGNFATSMKDLINFEMHEKLSRHCWFTGDSDYIVEKISEIHQFIVTDYFDTVEENKKIQHYQLALQTICSTKNIKLVELDWQIFNEINPSILKEMRHPTADEHKQTADLVYARYYSNYIYDS